MKSSIAWISFATLSRLVVVALLFLSLSLSLSTRRERGDVGEDVTQVKLKGKLDLSHSPASHFFSLSLKRMLLSPLPTSSSSARTTTPSGGPKSNTRGLVHASSSSSSSSSSSPNAQKLLVKPQKALELIQSQKYAYVDVRTKHEFETVGHHKNSTCIPYFVSMGPPPEVNPDFVKEVEMKFPRKDCPLLIGCAAGGRSAKASATLREAGYTNIADLEGGFKAWASEFGDMIETGCGC